MFSEPRNDFANAVRKLSTTTASRATGLRSLQEVKLVRRAMLESGQRCPPKISRNAAERDVVSITDRNLASESYAIDGRAVDPVLRSYRRALTGATVHSIERPGFSGA